MRWSGSAEAGLVRVGLIAIDGTKVHVNASQHPNRDHEQLAREILAEADAVDSEDDELYGEARGDELPAGASDRAPPAGVAAGGQAPAGGRALRGRHAGPALAT